MNIVSIIGCIVGIVSCVIGVSTFVSAQVTKAKQDGMLIAKIEQCVKGIEEIKSNMKEKNHELDKVLDEHTKQITELKTQMKTVLTEIGGKK